MAPIKDRHGFKLSGERGATQGFHVTFANGYTLSVQWEREGLYSDRHPIDGVYQSAEVAIIAPDGSWCTRRWKRGLHDDVAGWQNPEDVAGAIAWAKRQPMP